jgi:ubiquinone/menaquinone biosynthesis C-methylase UbiE
MTRKGDSFKFSHKDARAFYDRLGIKQDWQRFYEDPAVAELLDHGNFRNAESVFELGCGTGRLAETLLERYLSPDAHYTGIDVSSTMVTLASIRLAKYGERARVMQTSGEIRFDVTANGFDRLISTYVLDLLPVDDIRRAVVEAGRILKPGGLLCLVSLTHGLTLVSRMIEKVWTGLHALKPSIVGGCRPLELQQYVYPPEWRMKYVKKVSSFGIVSEVLIAEEAT